MSPAIPLSLVLFLAACATRPPVVSDISDSSVKVQGTVAHSADEIAATAQDACALYGKSPSGLSERCLDGYCLSKEWLFACH